MAELFDTGIFSVEDTDGSVGVGWKLNFYTTGTSTRQDTYPTEADADAGTNANTNPVVADAAGRFPEIWLKTTGSAYKSILTTAADVVKETRDPAMFSLSRTLASTATDKGANLVMTRAKGSTAAQARRLDSWIQDRDVRVLDFYEATDANDSVTVQRAIDKAADWSSAAYAQRLVLTDWFDVPSTITLRPYVYLAGIGRGRCGLKPTAALTGPTLDMDSFTAGSSAENVVLSDFAIDGVNATGSAYAMRLRGQKNAQFRMLRIANFLTSDYALQIVHNGYGLTFDGLTMRNCNRFLKAARETVVADTSFPTTAVFRACLFEEGPSIDNVAAFLLQDCNSFLFTDRCIFQSIDNRILFQVEAGADRSTTHAHEWSSCYFESNGNAHADAITWKLIGISANRVDDISIVGNHMHGSGGGGGHIHATYTRALRVIGNHPVPGQKWLTDGGNNDRYDIDAVNAGDCDLQSMRYSETSFQFDNAAALYSQDGPLGYTLTRNAAGEFYVDFVRPFTGGNDVIITANARDGSVNGMFAQGYMSTTSRAIIRVTDAATGGTLTDPIRCFVRIMGKLDGL